jgi:hypothetical protein
MVIDNSTNERWAALRMHQRCSSARGMTAFVRSATSGSPAPQSSAFARLAKVDISTRCVSIRGRTFFVTITSSADREICNITDGALLSVSPQFGWVRQLLTCPRGNSSRSHQIVKDPFKVSLINE